MLDLKGCGGREGKDMIKSENIVLGWFNTFKGVKIKPGVIVKDKSMTQDRVR